MRKKIIALGAREITGRAVALHFCKAYSKINRKIANSTNVKS